MRRKLRTLYKEMRLKGSDLSFNTCREQLLESVNLYSKTTLVLDALDECEGDSRCQLLEMVDFLLSEAERPIKIFIASRPNADIRDQFLARPHIEIQATDNQNDIEKFVNREIVKHRRWNRFSASLRGEIVKTLLNRSDGMFQWAYLQVKQLLELRTEAAVRDRLGRLPIGLEAAYDEIYAKIAARNQHERILADRAFTWVMCACHPLDSAALLSAVRLDPGGDVSEEIDEDVLLDICNNLLVLDSQCKVWRFSHLSVTEYFERNHWSLEQAHCHATKVCLLILSEADKTYGGMIEYAATYLGFHARQAGRSAPSFASTMEFLRKKRKPSKSYEILLRQYSRGRPPDDISGAHLAAHFGLLQCLADLAAEGWDLDSKDENGETPLLWAARNDQEDTAMWLLQHGVDLEVRDFELKSVLHHVVLRRWERPLLFLLEKNAKITADIKNMTPVHYAIYSWWEEGIGIFINAGVSINTFVHRLRYHEALRDGRQVYEQGSSQHEPQRNASLNQGLTPLHLAALSGLQKPVRFLLDRGADPTAMSEYDETPLHLAVRRGLSCSCCEVWDAACDVWDAAESRIETVLDFIDISDEEEYVDHIEYILRELSGLIIDLLRHPASAINARTSDGSQALHLVRYGHWSSATLVNVLVKHGAGVSGRNSKQQTPLLLACAEGDVEVVRLLLNNGALVTESDDEGRNALHYAAMGGKKETVLLILDAANKLGLNLVLSRDRDGRNALHHLLGKPLFWDCKVLQPLLEQGAEVNGVDKHGMTPLVLYISQWFLLHPKDVIENLLHWQADISHRTPGGRLGLGHTYASSVKLDVDVLKLLAGAGLNLRDTDAEGKTVLHHSAQAGSLTQPALEYLNIVGLSPNDIDAAGMRALDYATEMSSREHDPMIFDPDRWIRTVEILTAPFGDSED
ncbi:ankyrin repeat-containing domain protein [Lasiosphaeria miniovina]|uniref:Ankyrin repeat-containing domain protein n=1 Tax=Lasiosphaeria miniovina TaxID=1954250 RepID=A0AA39ZQ31_9PEZI|nr:ankyrin repeat-containing domain protein [Lasiosphaeria miniovina]KAK0701566.1 ankyrin repeat-containing domain protein [Lasiosphaeria miniovina]